MLDDFKHEGSQGGSSYHVAYDDGDEEDIGEVEGRDDVRLLDDSVSIPLHVLALLELPRLLVSELQQTSIQCREYRVLEQRRGPLIHRCSATMLSARTTGTLWAKFRHVLSTFLDQPYGRVFCLRLKTHLPDWWP